MRTRAGVLVAFALFVCPALLLRAEAQLTVTFINVGQGDCCWLDLPSGDHVLVDGGKPQVGPTLVAFLYEHGVSDIDLMVATHGDSDHIGGLLDVLLLGRADRCEDLVATPEPPFCGHGDLLRHTAILPMRLQRRRRQSGFAYYGVAAAGIFP